MLYQSVSLVLTMLALSTAIRAQEPDAAVARAQEIIRQGRAALGGDAALNAVKSLSASGEFHNQLQGRDVSGQLKLELLLPDKFMRTFKWSPRQSTEVSSIETVNGEEVWTDTKVPERNPGIGSLGGGRLGRMGGGRGMGRGGSRQPRVERPPAPGTGESSPEFQRQMRADFSCLLIALSLASPDPKAAFTYDGEQGENDSKADILKVKGGDGITYTVGIDRKSHRPVTVGYDLSSSGTPGTDGTAAEARSMSIQFLFSDYELAKAKGVGGVWLPHEIIKTSDGRTLENMRLKKLDLNPSLKPKHFEKKTP